MPRAIAHFLFAVIAIILSAIFVVVSGMGGVAVCTVNVAKPVVFLCPDKCGCSVAIDHADAIGLIVRVTDRN